jgi:hypothetical protein
MADENSEAPETGEPVTPETSELVKDETAENNEVSDGSAAPDNEETQKPVKGKGRFSERFKEVTDARNQAEHQARVERARADELERQLQTQRGAKEFPKLANYNFDENKYQQAIREYYEAETQSQKALDEQTQLVANVRAKAEKAKEKYGDFDQVIMGSQLSNLQTLNQAAYEALLRSPNMADISYQLAKNPAQIYEFGSMTPLDAVKTIGRLEDGFNKPAAASVAHIGEPPTILGGNSSVEKDPHKMTTEEWMVWRNKQVRGKAG